MAKVYVSSTYEDLKDCRMLVRQALQRLHQEDIAMETYVAEPERPLEKCLNDVAQCDIYVGVIAWRYGYIIEGHDRSITELEYRHAVEKGIDRLIFLLSEDAPWPPKYVDKGPDASRIQGLREELTRNNLCSFFDTPQELAALVTTAVANRVRHHDGVPEDHAAIASTVLASYYERLQQQYGRLDLDALTPPQREEYLQIQLRSVYIEQSVREHPPPVELPKELWQKLSVEGELDESDLPVGIELEDIRRARETYHSRPTRQVLNLLTSTEGHRIVLLGDPGSGKSTLARYIVLCLATSDVNERLTTLSSNLPVLVELRSYAALRSKGKCDTFLEYLDYVARTEGFSLTAAMLESHLMRDGGQRTFIVFDGLDELFDPADRDAIARQIAGFAAKYSDARILVTSRIIGYRRSVLSDAGFGHFTLQDLDGGQINEFLQNWYALALHDRESEAERRRLRLSAAIQESRSIRELAGNPLLLTILAIIGKHQELPRERWKVYDHAAAVLVEHWDVNRHLRDSRVEADFVGEEDKKELLRRVAHRMQSGAGGLVGNYLPAAELQAEFEQYLTERYQRDPADAKVIALAMIDQFRERNFILSRYGAGLYGFVHRAFLEYFCADTFVWRFEKTRELSLKELKGVFAEHWNDEAWREVLRLIAGMVAERFSGHLIEFLLRDVNSPWPKKFGNRPPSNIALAVQCLSELRNLGVVSTQAALLLDTLAKLLQHSTASSEFATHSMLQEEVVPAVESIGPTWPGRHRFLNWFNSSGREINTSAVSVIAVRIVAGLFSDSTLLRDALLDMVSGNYQPLGRAEALSIIVETWHEDAEAFSFTHRRAVNDSSPDVRQTALDLLVEYWPENRAVITTLRDRAVDDQNFLVRRAAFRHLVAGWPDDPELLHFLLARVNEDAEAEVRVAILQQLVGNWPEDPTVIQVLRDCVISDRHRNVRRAAARELYQLQPRKRDSLNWLRRKVVGTEDPAERRAALEGIMEAWPNDAGTLSWLERRATSGTDTSVRRFAIEAIADYWPDIDITFSLLKDRARNDEDEAVRRAAYLIIFQRWPDEAMAILRDSHGLDE